MWVGAIVSEACLSGSGLLRYARNDGGTGRGPVLKSFCFFFQKEALSC
jgi:hypothetical protein